MAFETSRDLRKAERRDVFLVSAYLLHARWESPLGLAQGYERGGHPKHITVSGLVVCTPARVSLFNCEKRAGAYPQPWGTTVPKETSVALSFPKHT